MRISEVAATLGVPSHVLRHWEDAGVLVPDRIGTHRDFTEQHLQEAAIVHRLRRAGLGLPTIRALRTAAEPGRQALLGAAGDGLEAEAARLAAAAAFLRHTLECLHPVIEECDECRAYASVEPNGQDAAFSTTWKAGSS